MLTEGTGLRAPKPVRIALSRADLQYCQQKAKERAVYRDYGQRQDMWGVGMYPSSDQPINIGICGEQAVCIYLRRRLPGVPVHCDTSLRPRGDKGYDIEVRGLKIEVKTRARGRNNLVRRYSNGRVIEIKFHAVVFARFDKDEGCVYLLGWCSSRDLMRVGKDERGAGDWMNTIIDGKYLEPMNDLVCHIKTRVAS